MLAIGKLHGFAGSLRFFAGLQVGLALVAGVCVSGVLSVLSTMPGVTWALTLAAILYLASLAWSIAMTPVAAQAPAPRVATTFSAGLLLGISNPKAYLGFITLFASQTLVSGAHVADAAVKWALTVIVILIVDVAWLYAGARLGRVALTPKAERGVNMSLGLSILVVALYSLRVSLG